MARLLKGKLVSDDLIVKNRLEVEELRKIGIVPKLAIFRIGNKDNDLSYERGIENRARDIGVELIKYCFAEDVSVEEFYQKLDKANNDQSVHGILVFRPLPERFDNKRLRNSINVSKDVDGCNDLSLGGIFIDSKTGYPPCTAASVMAMLEYYDIDVKGKNIVILGRSLVIGRPVSMMLLNKNATVTICHSRSVDTPAIARKADILICAMGKMETINKDYVNANQTIIDVGISWNEKKNILCGDVLFEEVEPLVKNISPVPGGVGSLTSTILISHTIEAAKRSVN